MDEQEILPFISNCEEFAAGKFILPEIKIAAILKTIDENEKLKNIVSTSISGYNFDENLENMVLDDGKTLTLNLPSENENIIAFVYNLLYRVENKSINFNNFVAKFFVPKTENSSCFNEFANKCITPFKEAVVADFNNRHIKVETPEYQNNYFNKIKTTVKLILSNMDNYKLKMNEKEEFTMLLNSLYLASERNDKKLVYSLMIGIDYFTKCFKKARVAYLSLEECFVN